MKTSDKIILSILFVLLVIMTLNNWKDTIFTLIGAGIGFSIIKVAQKFDGK